MNEEDTKEAIDDPPLISQQHSPVSLIGEKEEKEREMGFGRLIQLEWFCLRSSDAVPSSSLMEGKAQGGGFIFVERRATVSFFQFLEE